MHSNFPFVVHVLHRRSRPVGQPLFRATGAKSVLCEPITIRRILQYAIAATSAESCKTERIPCNSTAAPVLNRTTQTSTNAPTFGLLLSAPRTSWVR